MSIINTALIGKLKKTKADKNNVLELTNSTTFVPSSDYQPATKKYVDDALIGTAGGDLYVYNLQVHDEFVAGLGQTQFQASQAVGSCEVYLTGVRLPTSDYTVAGDIVTILVTVDEGDDVIIDSHGISTAQAGIRTIDVTTSSTSPLVVDQKDATVVRSQKMIIQASDTVTGEYHTTELMVVHNGTDAFMTEYGTLFTGLAPLATYSCDIATGLLQLTVTLANAHETLFKIIIQDIGV